MEEGEPLLLVVQQYKDTAQKAGKKFRAWKKILSFYTKVSSMEENFDSLKRCNFWDGNVPQLGFLREDYTNNIFDYTNNKLIKVLVGQRRAGKVSLDDITLPQNKGIKHIQAWLLSTFL